MTSSEADAYVDDDKVDVQVDDKGNVDLDVELDKAEAKAASVFVTFPSTCVMQALVIWLFAWLFACVFALACGLVPCNEASDGDDCPETKAA